MYIYPHGPLFFIPNPSSISRDTKTTVSGPHATFLTKPQACFCLLRGGNTPSTFQTCSIWKSTFRVKKKPRQHLQKQALKFGNTTEIVCYCTSNLECVTLSACTHMLIIPRRWFPRYFIRPLADMASKMLIRRVIFGFSRKYNKFQLDCHFAPPPRMWLDNIDKMNFVRMTLTIGEAQILTETCNVSIDRKFSSFWNGMKFPEKVSRQSFYKFQNVSERFKKN